MNLKHLKTFESFSKALSLAYGAKPEANAATTTPQVAPETCKYCDENGESECYVCAGYGTMDCCYGTDCDKCGGDGITTCYACKGTRRMPCMCQEED
jgi:hypothetical protein